MRLSGDPTQPSYVVRLDGVSILVDFPVDFRSLAQYVPASGVQAYGAALSCAPLEEAVLSRQLASVPGWKPPIAAETKEVDPQLLKTCNGQVFVNDRPQVALPAVWLVPWSSWGRIGEGCGVELWAVDVGSLDAVLVSHAFSYAGLPFLFAHPDFRARVFATEPTARLGGFARPPQLPHQCPELLMCRLMVEELVELFTRVTPSTSTGAAEAWKEKGLWSQFPNPPPSDPRLWRPFYDAAAGERVAAAVEVVAYREKVDVFGLAHVTALSSGFAIGASNWLIQSDFERVLAAQTPVGLSRWT